MQRTVSVQLQPTAEQREALLQTLRTANAACDAISDVAFTTATFRKYDLQKACYYNVRHHFKLPSQMVIRCLAKVADAYKLDRDTKRTFHPLGSVAYDSRNLYWRTEEQSVSLS